MEPRLKWNKIIFRVLQCSAVRPVLSCADLRFVRRCSAVRSAVVCGFQTYPVSGRERAPSGNGNWCKRCVWKSASDVIGCSCCVHLICFWALSDVCSWFEQTFDNCLSCCCLCANQLRVDSLTLSGLRVSCTSWDDDILITQWKHAGRQAHTVCSGKTRLK